MYDPVVLKSKAITMQRMMLAVTQGYTYWVGGHVDAARALAMSDKFADLYVCDCTTQQRYRRKQQGKANTRLFLYPAADTTALNWWLLCTNPSALENGELEDWRNVTTKAGRMVWGYDYELVRLPYPKPLAKMYRDQGNSRVEGWTWRMQRDCYEAWRARLRKAAAADKRGSSALAAQAIHVLNTAPGFRGVREAIWELRNYYNSCRRANGLPPYEFVAAPRWMRARKCREWPLSSLVGRAESAEESWFS